LEKKKKPAIAIYENKKIVVKRQKKFLIVKFCVAFINIEKAFVPN